MSDFKPGNVFSVPYPFYQKEVSLPAYDEGGPFSITVESWIPGTEPTLRYPDEAYSVYDGIGQMIITVVDTFKPGHFPERVFYTRVFKTPDGKLFGKGGLRIKTLQAFKRLIGGYRYWDEAEQREPAEAA